MLDTARKAVSRICAAAVIVGIVGLTSVAADAPQRYVIVNGQMLTPQQLYVLDRINGGYIPNGSYWLDTRTGVWGYAGDPTPRGRLGSGGGGGYNAPAYSGQLDRGPFGTYMSDGQCSFVNGIPVGAC